MPIQDAFEDMAAAEQIVSDALAGKDPGQAMSAILRLYQDSPENRRAALVAVLATRVAISGRRRS
jgi:hypothetical protein